MELILLKSTACLAIFMVFYRLLLEKKSFHNLKRFYLLGALVLSIAIPLITITEYTEVSAVATSDMFTDTSGMSEILMDTIAEQPLNYWTQLLWLLYGMGLLFFASKFVLNLRRLYSRIRHNEKQKASNFIYVLLKDLLPPHTFFNYIFLNKSKVENKAIPQEVLLHEETHAKQKHSIDILFIELLQVVFWFNPLLYFIKKDIRLNHEFLADAAVLKYGVAPQTYQHILLQFSSNNHEFQLANAINYSSIKKRFTLMKTQTSKTRMWLSTLLVLPLIAVLFYSFSNKEFVEIPPKDQVKKEHILLEQNGVSNKEITAYNAWAKTMKAKFKNMPESEKVNGYPHMINDETFRHYNSIYDRMTDTQKGDAESLPEAVLVTEWPMPTAVIAEKPTEQQNLPTAKEIKDYNTWAKAINKKMADAETKKGSEKWSEYPIVKVKDVKKYKAIYDRMTEAQKTNAEPWPNFPPPPPPPPAPKAEKNKGDFPPPPPPPMKSYDGKLNEHHINAYNEWIKYIKSDNPDNRYMTKPIYESYRTMYEAMTEDQKQKTDGPPPPPPPVKTAQKNKGDIPPPPPPPKPASKNVKIEEIEMPAPPPPPMPKKVVEKYAKEHPESVTKEKINGKDVEIVEIPSPPPPPSMQETIKNLGSKGVPFYLNGKTISLEEVLQLAKADKIESLNVTSQNKARRAIIKLK